MGISTQAGIQPEALYRFQGYGKEAGAGSTCASYSATGVVNSACKALIP